MKVCPQCNTSYDDDSLNFCLEDGSALVNAAASPSPEPPPTVMVPPANESAQNQTIPTAPRQDEIRTAPRYDIPAQKKSKTWILVIGALFLVMVVCGGGLIGLVAFMPDEDASNDREPDVTDNRKSDSGYGDPSRSLEEEEDLSEWEIDDNDYISTEVRQGDLVLTSVDDYYYVVLSRKIETYNGSTSLTLRNITGEETSSGIGLVVHSAPDAVLKQGYALLLRTDEGKYRIIQHLNKRERVHVGWKRSDAINRGKSENHLEVRADGRDMEFYINGELVKKLRASDRFRDGVAGIYTSDDIPIAFSKLELRR